jgi:phospholipase/lecithinase/hemolysin
VGTCGKDIVVNGQLMAGSSCTNPSEYVHWDAVHLTDAANRIIAQYFLTGQYLQPYYALSSMCNLSFKHFTT